MDIRYTVASGKTMKLMLRLTILQIYNNVAAVSVRFWSVLNK